MNRQQFNKYLAGHSMPSRHNLRRICAFFGVEEAEIMLPNRRFAEIVELRPRGRRDGSEQPIDLQHIELLRRLSGNKLDAYLGYYYRYFYSYRSEERRVGKEGVSTCRSRRSPDNSKKKKRKTNKLNHK